MCRLSFVTTAFALATLFMWTIHVKAQDGKDQFDLTLLARLCKQQPTTDQCPGNATFCTSTSQCPYHHVCSCSNCGRLTCVPLKEAKVCGCHPIPRNGYIMQEYKSVKFHCHTGFQLIGTHRKDCIDGVWMPANQPHCEQLIQKQTPQSGQLQPGQLQPGQLQPGQLNITARPITARPTTSRTTTASPTTSPTVSPTTSPTASPTTSRTAGRTTSPTVGLSQRTQNSFQHKSSGYTSWSTPLLGAVLAVGVILMIVVFVMYMSNRERLNQAQDELAICKAHQASVSECPDDRQTITFDNAIYQKSPVRPTSVATDTESIIHKDSATA